MAHQFGKKDMYHVDLLKVEKTKDGILYHGSNLDYNYFIALTKPNTKAKRERERTKYSVPKPDENLLKPAWVLYLEAHEEYDEKKSHQDQYFRWASATKKDKWETKESSNLKKFEGQEMKYKKYFPDYKRPQVDYGTGDARRQSKKKEQIGPSKKEKNIHRAKAHNLEMKRKIDQKK